MEYGNMWHVCEEHFTQGSDWKEPLRNYAHKLARQYFTQASQVEHWYRVCCTQFPIYIEYWAQPKDVAPRMPIASEHVFDVQYKLPSGRTVRLRGKFDSVDIVGGKVWLQENKARGDVDENATRYQLAFDLQTGFYMVALNLSGLAKKKPIAGVRYNVIRRPLSGGKHSIKPYKPNKTHPNGESMDDYYKRLGDLIREEPDYYFGNRFEATYSSADLERFKQRILDPLLEQLWDWWLHMKHVEFDPWNKEQPCNNHLHWQHPNGIYNPINETGHSDLEEYLRNGSRVGLQVGTKLFRELE
jgi:hypothetical protein